ncbi:MAG: metallophosphoesterase family protein [Oscillospiraceae bacterium]|jgi:UDP-2,3-diacylglucosamine pyrophosphatase LpxH|nr:metallophosphoesterase family protein [Oscillospiraceae bacterium]
MENHIDRAYANARVMDFDDSARIVIMSDCHRGYGGWADSFSVNQNNYFAALRYYERNMFTYFELGDGDELWENRRFSDISAVHCHVFWLLAKLYDEGRLVMLYGNHDIEKKQKPGLMNTYYDATKTEACPLFPGMTVYESVVLRRRPDREEIFLLHGHQADFLNDSLWPLARFLVRHLWKPLQVVGIKAPATGSVHTRARDKTEKLLSGWASANRTLMIAGHTHRPVFPEPGQSLYLNDGSCVHPRCITAIELASGSVSLVKWSNKTKPDGTLYVGRDVLAGPYRVASYYRRAAANRAADGLTAAR